MSGVPLRVSVRGSRRGFRLVLGTAVVVVVGAAAAVADCRPIFDMLMLLSRVSVDNALKA